MNRKLLLGMGFVLCTSLVASDLQAQTKVDKDASTKSKTDSVKPVVNSYAKLLKNPMRSAKGLLNIYQVKEKLYLEIPIKLMGREMLLASTISETSDNLNGIVGSKPQDPLQVSFVKVDSTILLNKIIRNTIAPEKDINLQNALAKNSIGAIIEKFPIQAYNEDKTTAVIDVTNFFVSDNKELSPFGAFRLNAGGPYRNTESFKKDRSFVTDVKAFTDNVSIKSSLTYENSIATERGTIYKDRPFTTVMTRTFLLLPEQAIRPRIADPRIGIFITGKNKLSNEVNKSETVYFANHFNLVPKDAEAYANGKLVEPIKPITFYVDSDFPEAWKPSIKAAISEWSSSFEKIGYKNAVVALDYPTNDPEFDPDNLKYNCVRYAPTPVANAIGPSWVDPRSGEIINASVYVFHDIVKLLNNWMFIQTAAADPKVRSVKLPEDYKNDGIKYVVRHEIGHCLGFMHNFAGSSSIPVDSLRSPSFTKKYGTTYSIMDYARFNYVAQPGDVEKGVKLSPPAFGLYDDYAVKWNYTYYNPQTVTAEQEKAALDKLVSEKAKDIRYRYGSQAQGFDPTILSEDLGDDAVKAAGYGVKNLKYIIKNLNTWVSKEDKNYEYRTQIWNGIISQYVRYINHVMANVGGFYINEKYVGDPRPFYKSVPRAKQVAAVKFLTDALQDLNWLEEKSVVENLPLTGTISTLLRQQITNALLATPYNVHLSAYRSKEAKPFTSKDVLAQIHQAVWKKTISGSDLTTADKDIQSAYVNFALKNSKLVTPAKAGANSFTDSQSIRISTPDFIKPEVELGCNDNAHAANGQVSAAYGFAAVGVTFNLMPALETLYYEDLKSVKALLDSKVKATSNKSTQMHYQLMLTQINNAIK
jgi:hypothetical protein